MHSIIKPVASNLPPVPSSTNCVFLAQPPKRKHKPQPINVRCAAPRALPRSTSSRRRSSFSGGSAFQSTFVIQTDSLSPESEVLRTPHLTSHGYTDAFSTSHQRRGSVTDRPLSAHRTPNSPRCSPRSAPHSPKRSPSSSSPNRRRHHIASPTSPFSPPSPSRSQGRRRAKSNARIPTPAQPPVPPVPKLSKFRSFSNLRLRSSSPAPEPPMPPPVVNTPKQTSKRSKRSATPAKGSALYAKYRPMPFIQEMQLVQFLEGGSMDSLIRRHHVHAGQGAADASASEVAHGYAFTDDRGMVWFDEEEEWEFACLLPRTQPQRKRGLKRYLGKGLNEESENEWEAFADSDERDEDADIDPDVLLARKDDELCAGEDDLAAFGGALDGAWARERPAYSVLKLPETKNERKSKRGLLRHQDATSTTVMTQTENKNTRTVALRKEFLASGFVPSSSRLSQKEVASSPPVSTSGSARRANPFRIFSGKSHSRTARSALNQKD